MQEKKAAGKFLRDPTSYNSVEAFYSLTIRIHSGGFIYFIFIIRLHTKKGLQPEIDTALHATSSVHGDVQFLLVQLECIVALSIVWA